MSRTAWSRLTRPCPSLFLFHINARASQGLIRLPSSGPGLALVVGAYNTIWLFLLVSVVLATGSCLVGQTARLPIVAEAADMQVR